MPSLARSLGPAKGILRELHSRVRIDAPATALTARGTGSVGDGVGEGTAVGADASLGPEDLSIEALMRRRSEQLESFQHDHDLVPLCRHTTVRRQTRRRRNDPMTMAERTVMQQYSDRHEDVATIP